MKLAYHQLHEQWVMLYQTILGAVFPLNVNRKYRVSNTFVHKLSIACKSLHFIEDSSDRPNDVDSNKAQSIFYTHCMG